MKDRCRWLVLSVVCIIGSSSAAQGQVTRADYERADAFQRRVSNKVFKGTVRAHWSKDNDWFWYRNDLADGDREFIAVHAREGRKQPAFDHEKLAAALNRRTGKPFKGSRLPVDRIADLAEPWVTIEVEGKTYRFDARAETLEPIAPIAKDRELEPPAAQASRRRGNRSPRGTESPDGQFETSVKKFNLQLKVKATSEIHPLTSDGTEGDAYEAEVFWAPDSKSLVALKTARAEEHKVFTVESSPRDQVQPRIHSHDYLKPGDRIRVSRPHLFDAVSHERIPVVDTLFKNPWSLEEFRWEPDSSRFRFLYNERGHQVLRIVAIDAKTGEASTLIDEASPTFIDYSQKSFRRELPETREMLWSSERDGWNHLYLFDMKTGTLKNQVTRGEWVVRGVERVDEVARQIWFRAAGIVPGQDPYYIHHARVNFDGTGMTILTEGDGTHTIAYSPDRDYLIDTYSRVDMPPVTTLRSSSDGRKILDLEGSDASALMATGWRAPERFAAKGRDGRTEIFGVIFRPTTFNPDAKYPVIEQIYAGPQGAFVPKEFSPGHRAQALAELGFIVVQIDGMGTNWRSKAFHDVCWKNLGDAGFPDRILWLKAAAEKYPSLDLTRVGIYGGSAGGQNALGALLFHPDFYKVGVADCGCHDNRMDKIWWNEAWMGWPIGPQYESSSNVVNAHKLKGKLLLTVGELDRNVDPASTMQVVNALIRAGKDFDLVVFPGADHGAGGSRYGQRRLRDFFVRHLMGATPPDRNAGDSSDNAAE